MKLDSRNPFAAWGFEQEVYTKTADNEWEETGMVTLNDTDQGFIPADIVNDDNAFVDMNDIQSSIEDSMDDWSERHATVDSIFSNNENMVPTLQINKRGIYGQDSYVTPQEAQDLSNNYDLNYYGIQYADLYTEGDSKGEIIAQ